LTIGSVNLLGSDRALDGACTLSRQLLRREGVAAHLGLEAAKARLLLAPDQAPHEVGHDHKDQGVQKQTRGRRQTVGGCDPATGQGPSQLEGLGVGHDEKHGKGYNLLLPIHLVLLTKKFKL